MPGDACCETRSGINTTDVIISGDNMFVSTGYGYGCGLFKISFGDTPEAEEIYRNKNMSTQIDSAVLWEG